MKGIAKLSFAAVVCLALGCAEKKTDTPTQVDRGKYLVMTSACHDCHTPKIEGPGGKPVLDEKRLLSGHPEKAPYPTWTPVDLQERNAMALTNSMLTAWAGPWGVSFAFNLTPDKETGIAEWSEASFIQTLRTGKHQGQPNGREILPPMPWEVYRNMTDEDLKAIFAYLRTIPAVKNQVPLPVLPGAPAAGAKQ